MTAPRPKLRFGLWYAFRNPAEWPTTDQALYADVLDQIAWAETIGYDDVWLTEHHFVDDDHAPSPLVQAAAAAVKTKTIRTGTAVLLLPLYFQAEGARLPPLPVQKPPPPLWGGGFGPAAIRRAARLGDGYMGTADT